MSTSRGSGVGNGGGVQAIPAGSRKVLQSLKEIVNCSEAEIYAALKECNMDPNETVNRLLSQDAFHVVKSKREKKKEGKDNMESRARGANNSSTRRSKNSADRQLGHESSLHGKSTYKKENGSNPYESYLSSVPGTSQNNRRRGHLGLSDVASAESKGALWGTADCMPSVVQPASGYQSAWMGVPGQVSMADIVRMGRTHNKTSNAPNASHDTVQDSPTTESLHNLGSPADYAPKVHQSEVQHVPTTDDWPSIEKPAPADVTSIPPYTVDSEQHLEASDASFDSIDHRSEPEEVQEREDNIENSGGIDLGFVSISSRNTPENDSRGDSKFENELYKTMGSYQSEALDFQRHEEENVGASVSSVTGNLQQLNVEKDERCFSSEGNAPSVVIPDHLQVQTGDCSHLSFGSFGSGMNAAYSSGITTSASVKANSDEGHSRADISSGARGDTRNGEKVASAGSYDASSSARPEELKHESAEVAHGNPYHFPSSGPGYTLADAERLNGTFNETSSQMQNLAPFSNVMQSYTNSLPSTLLTGNVHSTRESDLQYSQFPVSHSMSTNYGNSVSSAGVSAVSMYEALKISEISSTHPAPQSLPGTSSVHTGPPLPQHIAVHPYSQPTLPLGPFTNMIGYPFLPQSYAYIPSAFQQSFAGGRTYHQSPAALPPQYKSSASVSSLPQSAAVPSGYGAFGSTATVPGNYSMNPPAASSGLTLSYDDVLNSQYKENSHMLSVQQNENPAMWLHGHSSRTVQAVPSSTHYNYQGQNQQPGGFRQDQQQSLNYSSPGYPNFYHSQIGISLDQQQNPRERSLGGSQGQPKQSQIWPNGY